MLLFIEVFTTLLYTVLSAVHALSPLRLITHDVGTFTFLGLQMRNWRLKEVKEIPEVCHFRWCKA